MKYIKAHELKLGDIFTKELKIKNREAFEVIKVEKTLNRISFISRNKPPNTAPVKSMKIDCDKNLIWLRNISG